jgi:biopolymer transport protein TolR
MAVSVDRSIGRNSVKRRRTRPMSEINVTPMVDVMLVLLVIFMVTAPLLTVGVKVDLPKTQASEIRGEDEPLAVSIDGRGRVFLQDTEVEMDALVPRLKAIAGSKPDLRIFVRGDKAIHYGRVMEVMSAIHAGGFRKVALLTEPFDSEPAAGRGETDKKGS